MRSTEFEQALDQFCIGTYEGIKICYFFDAVYERELFLMKTREALDLIKNLDPRRFRRVQTHIHYLVSAGDLGETLGVYIEGEGTCWVCSSKYWSHSELAPVHYAGVIVHEATHGLIEARGIRYNNRTRIRIERLCYQEERRFLVAHWNGAADQLQGPFDDRYYPQVGSHGFLSRLLTRAGRRAESARKADRLYEEALELYCRDRDRQAWKNLSRALKLDPSHVGANMLAGRVWLYRSEVDGPADTSGTRAAETALTFYEIVLRSDPSHVEALAKKVQTLLCLDRSEEAARTAETALRLLQSPGRRAVLSPELFQTEGEEVYRGAVEAFLAVERNQEARKVLERGLNQFPQSNRLRQLLALVRSEEERGGVDAVPAGNGVRDEPFQVAE